MSKRELIEKIAHDHTIHKGYAEVIVNAIDVEGWLHHPDQVPGRTITKSRFNEVRDEFMRRNIVRSASGFFELVAMGLGITVVPDPEPTNAEKLADTINVIIDGQNRGILIGRDVGVGEFAASLDRLGVMAPGGDDD